MQNNKKNFMWRMIRNVKFENKNLNHNHSFHKNIKGVLLIPNV
jgi:G:T/U-mismatch repair DNA glycosylase